MWGLGPFCNASKRGSHGQLFGRSSSSARCSNISITSEVVWAASNNFTSPEITEFVRDRAYLSPPFLLNGTLCGSWRLDADTLVKSPVHSTSFLDMAFSLKSITIKQNKKTQSAALPLRELPNFNHGITTERFQNSILCRTISFSMHQRLCSHNPWTLWVHPEHLARLQGLARVRWKTEQILLGDNPDTRKDWQTDYS